MKRHFRKRVARLETSPSISTVPEAAAQADADDIVAAPEENHCLKGARR